MVRKQNFSRKRQAILEALRSTKIHPTAEWVHQTLKNDYPDLSLGTVYRNLAQFKEEGIILSMGVINGQERFDANVSPHSHFICNCCGAVIDIEETFDSCCTVNLSRFIIIMRNFLQSRNKQYHVITNDRPDTDYCN